MINIFVFLLILETHQFTILQPSFVERRKIQQTVHKRLNYRNGKDYSLYHSDGIALDDDNNIQFHKPGKLVLNIAMIEGIDYALQFKLDSLNANHVVCVGIGGQGFILSEVLGIEATDLSRYQLGYCSDGTNSTKYPDAYTSYIEFEDFNEEAELDEIEYNYGNSEMTNKFHLSDFYMVLRDSQLIFMDNKKQLLMVYDNIDRARTYIPIVTIHFRNEIKEKIIKKRKCVVVEEDFSFIQMVLSFNPFKKEMPKEVRDRREQDKKDGKDKKETELGKMIKEKEDEDEEDDKAKTAKQKAEEDQKKEEQKQLHEQKRTDQTKELHEKGDAAGEEENAGEGGDEGQAEELAPEELEALNQDLEGQKEDQDQGELAVQGPGEEGEGEETLEVEEKKPLRPEDDTTESLMKVLSVQSHVIKPQLFDKVLVPLRPSLVVEDAYTIFQDNSRLVKILQDYKSCSYAYLNVKPAKNNFYLSVKIENIDDLYTKYPVGVGVYAYQMLDRLKGYRNLQDQLWCLDRESEDLWQYGALYRSDGTIIDSYMFGEYFKYKVDKEALRSTRIKIYFSNKNHVAFTFDDEKSLVLACVNPRFKYYVPIFELKAYKGVPAMTLEEYVEDTQFPFKYSDNDDAIFLNFFQQAFKVLDKFYVDKRGSFDEDVDDYTLAGVEGKSASINMWDSRFYEEQIEWWVRIDEFHEDKEQPQVCVGINQMSSEQIMEEIFTKNYKAQVAYLCDKNDFFHTFFQECPINANPIIFVKGTILRFRISNYLMQVHDGYTTVYFTLRKLGRTGIVPSAIIRGHPSNKVTFLLGAATEFGPNPYESFIDKEQMEAENFASYDVFSLPILQNAKNGLFKADTDEPLFQEEKKKAKVSDNKAPPIGKLHTEKKEEEVVAEAAEEKVVEEAKEAPPEEEAEKKLVVSNIPSEFEADQSGNTKLRCLHIYEHCNFEGETRQLFPYKIDKSPPQIFRSMELCKDTKSVTLVIDGHVKEKMIVDKAIECLPAPIKIDEIQVQ